MAVGIGFMAALTVGGILLNEAVGQMMDEGNEARAIITEARIAKSEENNRVGIEIVDGAEWGMPGEKLVLFPQEIGILEGRSRKSAVFLQGLVPKELALSGQLDEFLKGSRAKAFESPQVQEILKEAAKRGRTVA